MPVPRQSDLACPQQPHPQKSGGEEGPLPADVLAYVRYLMEKEREAEAEGLYRAEWVALGRVMDRFMLYLFLLLAVLGIVVFMCMVQI